jgi:16S rRNA (guanine1207-N2)-methyltransferase
MASRKTQPVVQLTDLLAIVPQKLRSPLAVIRGLPQEVAAFLAGRGAEAGHLCYHMDVYEAESLGAALHASGVAADIVVAPDLWDVPEPVATVVYPVPRGGERSLKLDMVEQAYHVLQPQGTLIVLSPYEKERLFEPLLKKVCGKVHVPAAGKGALFWCQREGERPRRRHEVTFQVQQPAGPSLQFVSRPGVFSYGRFDEGARALTEVMEIEPGDRIVDIGCGCGTNGILAGLRAGPEADVVFVDSNVRALALTEINAAANGLTHYQTVAGSRLEGLDVGGFDVALANPPYFAQHQIARLFIEGSRRLLRRGGRFYLVTRQPREMGGMIVENFGDAEMVLRRGYTVFCAVAS